LTTLISEPFQCRWKAPAELSWPPNQQSVGESQAAAFIG